MFMFRLPLFMIAYVHCAGFPVSSVVLSMYFLFWNRRLSSFERSRRDQTHTPPTRKVRTRLTALFWQSL